MPVCYHPGMNRLLRVAFVVSLVGATPVPAPAADDPLGRARVLYNQGQFEAAVNAAELARLAPGRTDSADLVAARAYLERFRVSAASDDLTNARERLRRLDPQRLATRERTEYIIGLGEALYLDEAYGAASAVFDSVLQSGDLLVIGARDRVLDWWADSVEHEGRPRPEMDRRAIYQRIRARMEEELVARPPGSTAPYWLVAAARGQGDLQGAWDAAQAAWVRSPLAIDKGVTLREDLDRLVLRAIIPDRAKVT